MTSGFGLRSFNESPSPDYMHLIRSLGRLAQHWVLATIAARAEVNNLMDLRKKRIHNAGSCRFQLYPILGDRPQPCSGFIWVKY